MVVNWYLLSNKVRLNKFFMKNYIEAHQMKMNEAFETIAEKPHQIKEKDKKNVQRSVQYDTNQAKDLIQI